MCVRTDVRISLHVILYNLVMLLVQKWCPSYYRVLFSCRYGFVTFSTVEEATKVQEQVST